MKAAIIVKRKSTSLSLNIKRESFLVLACSASRVASKSRYNFFLSGDLKPIPEVKKLKVLVAEDMKLNQLLMKIILTDFGFEYDIVFNGRLAIEKLLANSYDVILMDLHMPEMDGFETTEHIRNKMQLAIPIIALTSDGSSVDILNCLAAGMNDHILKPVDDDLLYRKIVSLAVGT